MTTAEIRALLDDMPEWLSIERDKHAPGTGAAPGTAVGERPVRREVPRDDEPSDD
jgi:hypothetical protein